MSESDNQWTKFYHMASDDHPDVDVSPAYNYLATLEDRYQDERELAKGGMKRITKAFDLKNSRTVAIARPHDFIKVEQYDGFIREAQLTSHLDHPNIIKVFDLGIGQDKAPYFTMELKVGDDLKQFINKRKIEEADEEEFYQCLNENLEIFLKVCDAIAYAHSVNVIHLDLKPSNIQVGEYGEVLVCDWGLGKLIGDFDTEEDSAESTFHSDMINDITQYGEIKGTPGYMAPEQVQPNLKKDSLTDIYALGGILYYILCQKIPLKGNLLQIVEKTKKNDIVFPVDRNPHSPIPESLDAVVRKAMALDPKDRYDDVESLRKEVYQYLRGFATQAEGASFTKQLNSLYQRRKKVVQLILLAIFIFIVTVTTSIVKINNRRHEAELALKKADEAIALYSRERNTNEALNEDLNKELEDIGKYFTGSLVYYLYPNKALAQGEAKLRKAIKKKSKSEAAWLSLGYIYFLKQKFKKSLEYLAKVQHLEDSVTLMLVSEKFSKIKKEDDELLKPYQLVELTKEFHPFYRKWLLIRLIAYDMQNRNDFFGYDKVLKAYLEFYNPIPSTVDSVSYDVNNNKLEVRGNLNVWGLKDEDFEICLFQIIPIDHLDLRSSGLNDLDDVSTLKIRSLDIRESNVTDLGMLIHMTHLKTLTVSIGQFSKDEILKVPARIKVEQLEKN